jgi:hypothetical protein
MSKHQEQKNCENVHCAAKKLNMKQSEIFNHLFTVCSNGCKLCYVCVLNDVLHNIHKCEVCDNLLMYENNELIKMLLDLLPVEMDPAASQFSIFIDMLKTFIK